MNDSLDITLVANAGLLIHYQHTTMLVDGIYGHKGHPFSVPNEETYDRMAAGKSPFEHLDYLLFTHAHPDHFSPRRTLDFLRKRRVKGVFMPDDPIVEESGLAAYLRSEKTPYVSLSDQTNRTTFKIEPEITVRAFRTLHLDKKFETVPHFCYVLGFGDKKILLTADADYVHENFENISSVHFDFVFMNPLFFGVLRKGKFFHGSFNTDGYCVYHVPFSRDDSLGMRLQLAKEWLNWPVNGVRTEVLCSEYQKMIL